MNSVLIRPRDVQFMRNALLKKFEQLLPDDDLPTAQNQNREGRVLSRALAATAVQYMTGFDPVRAVQTVIDGENDNGIDAIAVADDNETIVLVQAKWSFVGKSSFDTAAAHKLVAGLRLIELRDFARFNKRILPMISPLESVLPYGRIELVIAVNGPNQFTKEARQILDDACSEFNSVRPFVSYRMVAGAEVIQQIQKDIAPKPIDISVFLPKWLARPPRPNVAYTGWVSAESAAGWFEEHGTALFRQNLRSSLGRTHVNDGIMTTLVDEPDSFWNYNNGITVLCRSADEYFPGRKIEAEPIRLELSGASIINGAQTLTAIHATWKTNPQEVQLADVPITVIVVGPSDTEIANTITANRNTQNHVERRDLVALDPIQGMIWNDFASSLSKSYVYKRGEPEPAPNEGCSIDHAAIALACAHRNPALPFRARGNKDSLWESGSHGAYKLLFGEQPSAHKIWNSVLLHREICAVIAQCARKLNKRPSEIAERSDQLIAHIVFQLLDTIDIDEDSFDRETALKNACELTNTALKWFVFHLDDQFGKQSSITPTLGDMKRCELLVKLTLGSIAEGSASPNIDVKARKSAGTRRPTTVSMLIDHELLAEGTQLNFIATGAAEREALESWLNEDPRRRIATWVPERPRCLLWSYDGNRHTPTGLVTKIWELAGWSDAPIAVQGPARWGTGPQTLAAIAEERWREMQSE